MSTRVRTLFPKIIVIGECMIDKYWRGPATRLSPEGPYPVVSITSVDSVMGGAGNVVTALKFLASDTEVEILYQPGPKPVKNRLVANGQVIARWDEEDQCAELSQFYVDDYRQRFAEVNGVIVSDYGKGMFTEVSTEILNKALKSSLSNLAPVFIDTKQDPTLYSFYPNARPLAPVFFFPNQHEYIKYQRQYDDLSNVAYIVVTKGSEGAQVLHEQQVIASVAAPKINVVSVCGAGDVFVATFAKYYITGFSISDTLENAVIHATQSVRFAGTGFGDKYAV